MCYIRTPQVIPREPIEPLVSALCPPAPSARPTVCTTVCPCVAPPLVRPPNQAVRQPVPSLLHTSIPLTSAGGLVFSLSAGATSRVGVPTIDDAVTGPALGLRALGKRERPPVVDVPPSSTSVICHNTSTITAPPPESGTCPLRWSSPAARAAAADPLGRVGQAVIGWWPLARSCFESADRPR